MQYLSEVIHLRQQLYCKLKKPPLKKLIFCNRKIKGKQKTTAYFFWMQRGMYIISITGLYTIKTVWKQELCKIQKYLSIYLSI